VSITDPPTPTATEPPLPPEDLTAGNLAKLLPKSPPPAPIVTLGIGERFNPAEFENIEIEDDAAAEIKEGGLKRLKFELRREYKLRLFIDLARNFNIHQVKGDNNTQAIVCLGTDCPYCQAEEVDDENAAPSKLMVIPAYEAINERFGGLVLTHRQETDGDGKIRKIIKKGTLPAQVMPLLGSGDTVIDIVLRKPDNYNFTTRRTSSPIDNPPEDALAAFLEIVKSPNESTYAAFIETMTYDEMRDVPFVRNTLKNRG
jgi:hypothetical protein